MKLSSHITVSAGISAGVFALTGSPRIGIASFAAGFLMDLDHLFDYWRQHPWKVDMVHFFQVCEACQLKNLYLLFHSYEFIIFLFCAVIITKSPVLSGIFLGFAQHFIFDILLNPVRPQGYMFIYRLWTRFDASKIYSGDFKNGIDKSTK